MVRLVRFLDLLDPHIQRVKFLLDQVIEVVWRVENTVYRTHQEREEDEAKKLKDEVARLQQEAEKKAQTHPDLGQETNGKKPDMDIKFIKDEIN